MPAAQVDTVSLDGAAQSPRVEAVGPDAYGASLATRSEGELLVEAVQELLPLAALDEAMDLGVVVTQVFIF